MRITTSFAVLGAAALTVLAGCTVNSVDTPPLAGPSTMAHSITMVADRDLLTQNGVDFTDIRITALGPTGQSESIPLRAQIFVGDVAQDFGTLSTKTPTTPATIRYTAPNASTLAGAQQPTTVTIAVMPSNSGDFRGETVRQIDLQVLPLGVILPTNPNLTASFTFTPATPQAFQNVTFDASASLNGTTACASACSYTWNFGDGTTSSGITATKAFRAAGTFPVTLTVTDSRGAQTTVTRAVPVTIVAAPSGSFTTSPSANLATDITIFFNASAVTWAGRNITGYSWNFGDGNTGSGMTTSHFYRTAGTFTVTLTLTDDQGAQGRISQTLTISTLGGAAANFTLSTAAPKPGQRIIADGTTSTPSAGATIVSYRYIWGDGTETTSSNPIQDKSYTGANTGNSFTVTLVITDSNGKTASKSQTITFG